MPWAHGRAHEGGHRRRAAPGGPVRTLRAAGERRAGARRGARGFWDFGLRPSCRENGPPSAEAAPRCTARSPWRGSVRMEQSAENAGRVPLRPRASYPSLARRASRRRCKSSTCAARLLSLPCPALTPVRRMQSRRAGLQGRHARCRFSSPPPSPSCRLVRIAPPAPRAASLRTSGSHRTPRVKPLEILAKIKHLAAPVHTHDFDGISIQQTSDHCPDAYADQLLALHM